MEPLTQLPVFLVLERCPWCGTARPTLKSHTYHIKSHVPRTGAGKRGEFVWDLYWCTSCNKYILAQYEAGEQSTDGSRYFEYFKLIKIFPGDLELSKDIPPKVSRFLKQARGSVAQPDGCIMLCSSTIDAMLKEKNLKKGTLHERLVQASEHHIITEDMKDWADHVRLESNDIRHVDNESDCPSTAEAEQCLEFAMALAEILFVLPARVTRGRKAAERAGQVGETKESNENNS